MSEPSVDFDYTEAGSGPPVLFLPGSFGTGTGWKAVLAHLGEGYRSVTTSLLGYGSTPDLRPDDNATLAQQVDLIDRIIDRIGARPHVVGHSYGGLSALAHALTGRHGPASLLLVEANPLGLLRVAGDLAHYEMFGALTRRYFSAFQSGQAEAARLVIDFYGGAGCFDAMPEKARNYIVATTAVNVRDWRSGTPFEPDAAMLAAIDVPTTVVRGGQTHPAMRRIAERLHAAIPGSRLVTLEDGSHFLPSTHPADLAALVRGQVDRAPAP